MSTPAYDRTSILLHWIVGLAILGQFALGWWMVDIPREPPAARAWLHSITAWLLGALVALHVSAALWHLVRRDGIFPRMWTSVERG